MNEAEEEIARKEREWKEKRKKGVREIEVSIDTSSMEALVGKIKDLEPSSKAFDDLKQSLVRKCEREGLTVDSSKIKTAEDFRDTVQRMYDAKGEIPIRIEKSVGQIPLNQQSSGSKREFDSVESMLDEIRIRASAKNEEGLENQAILDELLNKALKGQIETKEPFKEVEIKGKILRGGREEGVVEKMNREFREREKRKKRDEERKK